MADIESTAVSLDSGSENPQQAAAGARETLLPPSDLRRSGVVAVRSRVGPYQLGPLIGRGGMGEVFAGFDPRLDRPVAIKRLSTSPKREGAEEEFRSEARHAARLAHPRIVRLYDFIRVDDVDYIVSELVDGVSLNQMLQATASGRLPLPQAIEIAAAVLDALSYAHENGVVHRDVKSANVLIARNGDIKLADFGVATSVHGLGQQGPHALTHALVGTPFAMSPEQAVGEYTDARSDLFSFGVMLYEMVSGTSPFLSSDALTSLRLVREAQPLPLSELLPEVPVALSKLVTQVLQKRREDRPESAREVKASLDAIATALENTRERERTTETRDCQVAVACVSLRSVASNGQSSELQLLQQADLMEKLDSLVKDEEGTLLSGAGTYLLFCIGFPRAHENNCEVALRALLQLESKLHLPHGSLSIGVDCGRVRLLTRSQRVLAVGEAIDRSIQLALASEEGGIVVTLAAHTLARRFFRFTPLASSLRHGERNIPVYRLRNKLSQDAGIEHVSSTPFRGRLRQLELLGRAFHDAQQGAVVTRLVVGDAGIGKSRLLHEWRREIWSSADIMLAAYATPEQQFVPFAPLINLVRNGFGLYSANGRDTSERERLAAALERVGIDSEPLLEPLSYALGFAGPKSSLQQLSSERRRCQIIDAFVALTLALARTQLAVLTFEDLHFVDRSTLDVLRKLAESPARARLLLVLTARPEFLGTWRFATRISQLRLDGLPPSEALQLIESVCAEAYLTAPMTRKLVELGDGVPLVLEELTRAVLADAGSAKGPFYYPTSLADSVARRLSDIEPAWDLARTAATIGRECPLALLRAVVALGAEEFRSRLRKLESAELMHVRDVGGESRCIFTHALVHEAVRNTIPAGDVRALNQRIAFALDSEFQDLVARSPASFAPVYAAAGVPTRALDLFQRAAQRAIESSAYDEAAANLQAALSLLAVDASAANPDLERKLRRALGPCLMAIDGWSAMAVAENLSRSRVLGEPETEFRELWGLWAHGIVTHDAEAVRAAAQGIASLTPCTEQRFIALSTQGVAAFYRGQFGQARPFLEQAVAMLPTCGANEHAPALPSASERLDLGSARNWGCEFTVAAAMHLSWLEALCGRRERAETVHGSAENLLMALSTDAEQRELRHAFYMRIHLGLTLGDYEFFDYSQLPHGAGALHRLFEIAGSTFLYYRCVAQLGEARARAAHGEASALDDLVEGYRRLKSLAARPTGHVFFASVIARACLDAGQLQRAELLVQEALEVAGLPFGAFYAPEAHRMQAECRLATGDLLGARDALRGAKSACLALDASVESPVVSFERNIAATELALAERLRCQL